MSKRKKRHHGLKRHHERRHKHHHNRPGYCPTLANELVLTATAPVAQ